MMVKVPPIKIQGIKTKLVPLIKKCVELTDDTLWVEPFMGSGVVGFNVAPKRAIFADLNPHIINFYNALKKGDFNSVDVKSFLTLEGRRLQERGEEYYKEVRKRFNEEHSPLDFLFLNRSCFNGMIRFNKKHHFNVPYCHKDERFAQAYVTKISNQVKWVEDLPKLHDWQFVNQHYSETLKRVSASQQMFVYCDPPYIGRHVDYFDTWEEVDERKLKEMLEVSSARFMISTWDYNKYRQNNYIDEIWGDCFKINKEHFYYVGAREDNRNPMMEALLVNYNVNPHQIEEELPEQQILLAL